MSNITCKRIFNPTRYESHPLTGIEKGLARRVTRNPHAFVTKVAWARGESVLTRVKHAKVGNWLDSRFFRRMFER